MCSSSTCPLSCAGSRRLQGASFPPPDKADIVGYDAEKYLAVWRQLEKAVDAGACYRLRIRACPGSAGEARGRVDGASWVYQGPTLLCTAGAERRVCGLRAGRCPACPLLLRDALRWLPSRGHYAQLRFPTLL